MAYVKAQDSEVVAYPYSLVQLKRDNPQTSFPKQMSQALLQSYNMFEVTSNSVPSYDERSQNCVLEDTPTFVDGAWVLNYAVTNKTADEISQYDEMKAEQNRRERNIRLEETDYYALTDVTMDAAMTSYRQALRDITTHENWPNLSDDDWPVKP